MPKRSHETFSLLYGDDVIGEGSEAAMKRQKKQYEGFGIDRPLRMVRSSVLRKRGRPSEVIDLEADRLHEDTKRLRMEQDDALEKALKEDRRRDSEQKALEEWKLRGRSPEGRATKFAELFQRRFGRTVTA